MRSVNKYDLNRHLHCGGPRPSGAQPATIKAGYVFASHRIVTAKAHRPVYAVTYWLDGQMHLGARYACGSASARVQPQPILGRHKPCARCEQVAARRDRNTGLPIQVYAYFDSAGQPLYIGQSYDLATRNGAHRQRSPWFSDVTDLRVLSSHETRADALTAEAEAIRTLRPLHNIRHNPERAA